MVSNVSSRIQDAEGGRTHCSEEKEETTTTKKSKNQKRKRRRGKESFFSQCCLFFLPVWRIGSRGRHQSSKIQSIVFSIVGMNLDISSSEDVLHLSFVVLNSMRFQMCFLCKTKQSKKKKKNRINLGRGNGWKERGKGSAYWQGPP